MEKKIKISCMLIIFVMLLGLTSEIYAASSFSFNVKADKEELNAGEIVTVEMEIANIDAGELGINTLEAYLGYDENVFEKVTGNDIEGQNNWQITYNGGEDARKGKFFAMVLSAGETENTVIGSIALKVKENIETQETKIRFTKIYTNDGESLVEEVDKEIVLKVNKKVEEEPPVVEENEIIVDNTAPGKIPQTGRSIQKIVMLVAVIGILIVAVMTYIKYRNIDR